MCQRSVLEERAREVRQADRRDSIARQVQSCDAHSCLNEKRLLKLGWMYFSV